MELTITALKRHLFLTVLCTTAGIVCGYGYLKNTSVTYYLQARVLVQPSSLRPEVSDMGRADPEFLPTQAETIRSPITVAEALKSVSVLPEPGQDIETFDPVRHVLESLTVTPIVRANVVTIGYRSSNTDTGERLITEIIDAYRKHVSSIDTADSVTNLEIANLEEQTLRKELSIAEQQYQKLLNESPLIARGENAIEIAISELSRYQLRLTELEKARALTQARLRELASLSGLNVPKSGTTNPDRITSLKVPVSETPQTASSLLPVFDAGEALALQQAQETYRLAKLQYEQLNSVYGDRHPALISALEQLETLDFNVSQRLSDSTERLQSNLRLTVEIEDQVRAVFAEKQHEVRAAQNFLSREETLMEDVQRLQRLHASAEERLTSMKTRKTAVSEGKASIDVRVLDGPLVLSDMTWPHTKTLLPLAAGVGLAVGLSLALLREWLAQQPARGSQRQDF